jgi:hypothetical protein
VLDSSKRPENGKSKQAELSEKANEAKLAKSNDPSAISHADILTILTGQANTAAAVKERIRILKGVLLPE